MIYQKGSDNPADFLSQHPQPKVPKHSIAEEYMNFVTVNATEAAIPLAVIREHTSKDSNLIAVQKAVESGDCTDKLAKRLFNIKDEIAMGNKNGVILQGTRIIIPTTLQTHIVKLAHAGHQGLAPKLCYANMPGFPTGTRLQNRKSKHVYRAKSTEHQTLQNRWQIIHADFYGPLPTRQYIIVLIGKYSRYPETKIIITCYLCMSRNPPHVKIGQWATFQR